MDRTRRSALYLDVAVYGLSALFAGCTALWSPLPTHRFWGAIAIGGYLPAAVVATMLAARYAAPAMARMWTAVGASLAVTVMPLIAAAADRAGGALGRTQEEVLVVEAAGRRLLDTGSPYLPVDRIAELPAGERLLGYHPYQPGMAVFGLPKAVLGDSWFTDARVWFAVVALGVIVAALLLLRRQGMPDGVTVRAVQGVGVLPLCALALATGGDDLPVLSLCLLALVAMSAHRWVAAGVAVGLAAALKLLAWPVLVVLLVAACCTGRRSVARFLPGGVGIPVLSLLPVLIDRPAAFVDNVVNFPLGNGIVVSPAASPLPGYLIANHLPAGRPVAIGLLGLAALLIGWWMLRRPPTTADRAAACAAVGLLAAAMLMPASRFGYLLYPAAMGVWCWCLMRTASPAPRWTRAPESTGTVTAGAR